jgi:hypothetical protein
MDINVSMHWHQVTFLHCIHLLHQVAANYGQLEACIRLVKGGAAFLY